MEFGHLARLCFEENNMKANWMMYKNNYEMFLKAYYDAKCSMSKTEMPLHSGGEELLDIFTDFSVV